MANNSRPTRNNLPAQERGDNLVKYGEKMKELCNVGKFIEVFMKFGWQNASVRGWWLPHLRLLLKQRSI